MERHAAHRRTVRQAAGFAGQGQFQLLGCRQGIVKEHLVKVTHAVKQNLVGVLALDFQILLHHGRKRLCINILNFLGHNVCCHSSHS